MNKNSKQRFEETQKANKGAKRKSTRAKVAAKGGGGMTLTEQSRIFYWHPK